jgi:tRNA pseudouridine38-40 synthase
MVAQIYCLTELAYAETKSPRTSNMTDNVLPYPLQQSIPGRRIPHPWNATDTTCFLTLPKPLPELISALNRMMIPDVQIMAVSAVPFTSSSLLPFHPTLSARRKTYRYTFSVGHRHDPIMSRTVWHLQDSALGSTWNEASVYQAGEMMCGLHRFAAFQGAPRGADDKRKRVHQNTLCTIDSINLRAASKADKTVTYTVDITGDRFLYKMVRLMTGALVAVGQGKLTLRNVEHLLSSDTRGNAPEFECAPAHGLVLYHVQYDDPIDWQSALS